LLGALAFFVREKESATILVQSVGNDTRISVSGLASEDMRQRLVSVFGSAASRWPPELSALASEVDFDPEESSTKIPSSDEMSQLLRMAELRDRGALTEEEFMSARNKILGLSDS